MHSRRHRLPQRLDWDLIPAPLDLSLPLVDEKAALPAIIVTPSSPTCDRDFSIAFLVSQEKAPESVLARAVSVLQFTPPKLQLPLKPRTLLFIFLPLFILMCHAIAHHMTARYPRLYFELHAQSALAPMAETAREGVQIFKWLSMPDFWESIHPREFIIEEARWTSPLS